MPELPEVEIVVRCLDQIVRGRKIESAELRRRLLAPHVTPCRFEWLLAGAQINFVHRRGKYILFDLDNGRTLMTHLRMSGRFMLLGEDQEDPKFTHAVFDFEGEERLVFQDQRHFGLMKIVETRKLYETREIAMLAPEPFSKEFSDDYFYSTLRASKRPIKLLLLDQTKVCGVGNIYASESLFLSGIHPATRSNRISKRRASQLRSAIVSVMNETLEIGSRIKLDTENIGGNIYGSDADAEWLVYGREGEPCPRCSEPINRIVQGGRSTFFCRRCQRR